LSDQDAKFWIEEATKNENYDELIRNEAEKFVRNKLEELAEENFSNLDNENFFTSFDGIYASRFGASYEKTIINAVVNLIKEASQDELDYLTSDQKMEAREIIEATEQQTSDGFFYNVIPQTTKEEIESLSPLGQSLENRVNVLRELSCKG